MTPPICVPWNIRYYDISDLQPGHENPRSSESDLVSGKMKEEIIVYYNNITITITYITWVNDSDT